MTPRHVHALLLTGALAGMALAGLGVLEPRQQPTRAVPDHAVAVVEGQVITRADYQRALANLEAERRAENRLEESARRQVLERLIDEELLVQRGLELGLAARDPRVRADLSAAVVDMMTARGQGEATSEDPGDAELERFYRENQAYFARPARVRVEQHWFADKAQAEAARAHLLAGQELPDDLRGDAAPVPIPDALISASRLSDYLGATALRFVLDAPVGQPSPIVPATGGYRVLRVLERQPAAARPFDEIREQVLIEYRRRAGERAVRRFLEERRERAQIAIAEDRL